MSRGGRARVGSLTHFALWYVGLAVLLTGVGLFVWSTELGFSTDGYPGGNYVFWGSCVVTALGLGVLWVAQGDPREFEVSGNAAAQMEDWEAGGRPPFRRT